MFRLVRWLISLAMTIAFVWFAVTVPLGKRTLWGHVVAIFSTKEAKDFADGTKESAQKVVDKVRAELRKDAGAPLDTLDEKDRRGLDELVKKKSK
jgi:hypothetical protein